MKKFVVLLALFAMPAVGSCAPRPDTASGAPASPASAEDLRALVQDNTAFALKLYDRLNDKPGNLFFAPGSISTALAMTYAGSRGATETQMAEAMNFTLGQARLHPAFQSLREHLDKVGKKGDIEISTANALWPHVAYKFLPDFVALNRRHYGVEITPVDYVKASDAARATINAWVEKKTAGKIKDLIAPDILDPLTRLVLTNAIYFKGFWEKKFSKDSTRPMPFHVSADQARDVPTMSQKGKFRYGQAESLDVLELPYRGGDLSMLVLLPRKKDGLSALEKSLNPETLRKWTEALDEREVRVFLPKFSITSQFGLSEALKALGMTDAFSMSADFSGMDGKKDLHITAVLHKAFVAVDEEGTEAAAATAVVIGIKSMPMIEEFRADHPFLFLIRENSTGSILFLGRVADPK